MASKSYSRAKQWQTDQARMRRLRVLYRIANLINSTTDERKILRRVLSETVRELGATSGSLSLLTGEDRNELCIVVALGDSSGNVRNVRLRVGEGIVGRVVELGKPLRVDDVSKSPFYLALRPEVKSELAVPLIINGQIAGVINVDSNRLAAFSPEDEKLLVAIANQAAKVIQTSRLYEQLAQQACRLEALITAGQALIAPEPLPRILQRITETVQQMLNTRLCSIMLLNEKRELVISAVSGGGQSYTQRAGLSVTNSLIGQVVMRRAPLQVLDVRRAKGYRYRSMARKEQLVSLLSVPILFQQAPIGIINIYSSKPRRFSDEEIRLLNAFASLCGVAIENARRYESLVQAEDNLRQADRLTTLGVLSAEIAHEIRNPVSIISMLVHSLLEDNAVLPHRRRDLSIISAKLQRISRIVEQVLTFSKHQEPRYEWVSLEEVTHDLTFMLSHTLATKSIAFHWSAPKKLPKVFMDRGHLEQILMNVFLNAIQAMPGGGKLDVRVRVASPSQGVPYLRIEITDTGAGIPQEIIPEIFQPFVTSRREGVGLGLFVCQKLLAQYGGKIEVSKTGPHGTTIAIHLPVEGKSAQS
ncbi:MAG: GAF domain-containing protein [Candidatus Sumerlaeaceae bacterium]|nr:GAF domain-containing protein [Candidatus Sumerlaeaceae bacterium]